VLVLWSLLWVGVWGEHCQSVYSISYGQVWNVLLHDIGLHTQSIFIPRPVQTKYVVMNTTAVCMHMFVTKKKSIM